MTAVNIVGPSGSTSETAELPDEIFDAKVNIPLMHQVVVAQLAAARQGTHATKTRGQVRGGGKKPYRQKGTGRARQGSLRAPQYAGGGTVHGPQPRSYVQRTPKKMKAAALRGALSDRARHGRVQVVSGFVDGDQPRTKDALAVLGSATGSGRGAAVLVVARRDDELTWKSLRNVGGRARPRRHPAQHLRRAGRRSCGLHRRGAAGVRRPRQCDGQRGGSPVKGTDNPRDILLRPVISEKSYGLLDEGKYTFIVAPDANKTEVRLAVEEVFGVKVTGVNTVNRRGKRRRTRVGWGKRPDTKRAIVTLAARATGSTSSAARSASGRHDTGDLSTHGYP